MFPENLEKKDYEILDRLLLILHLIFDSYFFLFIIPTNIFGPQNIKFFNLFIALLIAVANLVYRFRCPINVWRNKIKMKLSPHKPTHETVIGDFVCKIGLTEKPLSLTTANLVVTIFSIFLALSFFPF
ncbi:MAG: hypothetical protein COU06_01960 [Candidatus Harrisonbacteria bacterium CG10_big_fil_rev_8_21_14_0_10_38_8]|uniref:DUF2784 domain-containing protein n=1 Tax=Candidatus Harrisonbacteria bacterium CG10_big_fil_rev_8_21_14_0_10_38_8 TaxID=1974582 RepID=A0A2M6WJU3_9BACT|nr:MAG: hypothetical protein COU06_01960 [Candidatus Harrisonbacteria bacterium CG10_big_fil_rev_8_21_14_0_10_38_8]